MRSNAPASTAWKGAPPPMPHLFHGQPAPAYLARKWIVKLQGVPRGKARLPKQGKTFSHLTAALWKFGSGSSPIAVVSSREEGTMSAFADTEPGVTRPHSRTVTSILVGRGRTASLPRSSLGGAKSGP